MVDYKASSNKFKKIEIMSSIVSDYNETRNYKKKMVKITNMCRLNNMLLNNQWVKEEIKRKNQNIP